MNKSPAQIIGEKGVAVIAEATGREPNAIRQWKHRNCFPRSAWPELMTAFPEELSYEHLLKIEAAQS